MKVKRFARVMALSLSLALAVPSVVPGAALTAEAASKSVTLSKGSKKTLSVSTDKKVTWKSSKTSVATVSKKGVVKAVKAGTTTITATYGSTKKTWKVTVPNIRLNKKKLVLNFSGATTTQSGKDTATLAVLGLVGQDQQAEVIWDSSNTDVVRVKEKTFNPSRATVTAVKPGTATITAQYKKVKMTCEVTISSTGNKNKPEVSPASAFTFHTGNDNMTAFAPSVQRIVDNVKLTALDANFVSYVDASKAYLGDAFAKDKFYYTYHLSIRGEAVPEKSYVDYKTGAKDTDFVGTKTVKVSISVNKTGSISSPIYYVPNKENESYDDLATLLNNYQNSGYVEMPSTLVLKCTKTGAFGFENDIMTSEPIKYFDITDIVSTEGKLKVDEVDAGH